MNLVRGVLLMILASLLFGQEPVAEAAFYSGTVVALTPVQVTVRRRAMVSNAATETFLMDRDTKVEGKLRVKASVTIRYMTGSDGVARALNITVH